MKGDYECFMIWKLTPFPLFLLFGVRAWRQPMKQSCNIEEESVPGTLKDTANKQKTHSTDPFSILTQFPAAPLELERDGKVICDCVVALKLPKVSS